MGGSAGGGFLVSSSGRERIGTALRTAVLWAGILGAAAFAGIFALRNLSLAVPLCGLLLAASIVTLRGDLPDRLGNHRWIPYGWIALFVSASFRFTFTNTLDPSTSGTTENKVQLLVYIAVAILVLHSRRMVVVDDPRPIRKGLLVAWPLLAVASTLWSPVPLFTLVRSLQLFVPIGLAVLMARIWVASPEVAVRLWTATFRLFVQTVTILVAMGFAFGYGAAERFTWPGANATLSAVYVALAFLVLLAFGRSFLGFRRSGFVFRLLLFVTALYLGDTRGALAATLVGLAALIWFAGRRTPLTRYLGALYYGITLLLILAVALPLVVQYVERGGGVQGLTSLNGRVGLWQVSIDLVSQAGKWITGFGYGAARAILPLYVNWAGTAHSYWVELLVGLGIPGVLLGAADIVYLLRHLSSRASIASSTATVALLAFLIVNSVVSEILAFPGIGFGMLALLHVPVLAQRSGATYRDTTRVSRRLRAQPTPSMRRTSPDLPVGYL
jgi:hypothetical protein